MRQFSSKAEIDTLVDGEAMEIARRQAEILKDMLADNYHGGGFTLDDGGDYLFAAVENYHRLFNAYFDNDGNHDAMRNAVKEFLAENPVEWLGQDGDVRFEVFTEEYIEAAYSADAQDEADRRTAEEGGW